MVASENKFSPSDLLQYVEMLVKESIQETNNYSWLKSRHIQPEVAESNKELLNMRPMIFKMTSESCAKIAVKLDNLTGIYSSAAIITSFKKLVEEQYNIQLLKQNVKSAKEKVKNKNNRVHPVLMPDGRVPTVSFILY